MKKKYAFILLLLLNVIALYPQVGIGTSSPRGALDLNTETRSSDYGLVPPTNDPSNITTPQGGLPVNGTLIYDSTEDCLRVYAKDMWSPCLDIEDDDEGWNDKHIVRWGYGNWGLGIGNDAFSKFKNDLLDPANFSLTGLYKKVPGIEMNEFSIQQLETFRYIDYRYDIVSVDGSTLSEKAMDELIDFAQNGGYVFITLTKSVSINPPAAVFTKLGFKNIHAITYSSSTDTNNFTGQYDAALSNVFGDAKGGTINMGTDNYVNIPANSLPDTHKQYMVRPGGSVGFFVTGPRNRIAIIDTFKVYENSVYIQPDGTSGSNVLMRNLAAEAINKTLTDF